MTTAHKYLSFRAANPKDTLFTHNQTCKIEMLQWITYFILSYQGRLAIIAASKSGMCKYFCVYFKDSKFIQVHVSEPLVQKHDHYIQSNFAEKTKWILVWCFSVGVS